MRGDVIEHGRVHARDDADGENLRHQFIVEHRAGALRALINIAQELFIVEHANVREINAGKGVKVKIITEDNITKITSNQYANAAITAGVSDVEIDVASVSKVTGESALTGVYKALEANGETLDLDRTQVAQDELETTNEIAENNADNSNFDSGRLDQAMVEIKQELAEIKKNQGSAATAEKQESYHR